MFNSGILRDQAVFEQRTVTANANGGNDISWTTGFTDWVNPERSSEMNCRFLMRYRSGITPTSHRIIWDDVIWMIESAVHDLKRTMLTIECSLAQLQDVTHLTSTETEYIDGISVRRPHED